MQTRSQFRIASIVAAITLGTTLLGAAKLKVRAEGDKTYDFSAARTWAWDNPTPGKVVMLRTKDDDPEAVRKQFEATIMDAVASQLQARGLARAGETPPDLMATYYLVVKFTSSAQEMGQFLPATTFWGLAPFPQATTSFKVIQEGSIIVDLAAPSKQSVVWRGIAATEIDLSKSEDERKERIREAIRKILEKYPPKR